MLLWTSSSAILKTIAANDSSASMLVMSQRSSSLRSLLSLSAAATDMAMTEEATRADLRVAAAITVTNAISNGIAAKINLGGVEEVAAAVIETLDGAAVAAIATDGGRRRGRTSNHQEMIRPSTPGATTTAALLGAGATKDRAAVVMTGETTGEPFRS